jgi:phosphatidylserine/phosphatidylglycerophosphate/cardiolipin synthase-like enzyme
MRNWMFVFLAVFLFACTYTVPEHNGTLELYSCPSPDCLQVYESVLTLGVECAFYELNIPDFASALGQVEARVLLDEDNPFGGWPVVKGDGLMHHKFCVWNTTVVTGSMNPTRTNVKGRNLVLVVDNPWLAENYRREFSALERDSGSNAKYPEIVQNNHSIEMAFCPGDDCEGLVINALSRAKRSIYFAQFSFSSQPIEALLIEKHRAGINISGVFDPAIGPYSVHDDLKRAGIPVRVYRGNGTMHVKMFIIDDRWLVMGSYNPTNAGANRNHENVLVIDNPEFVDYAKTFFDDIWEESSKK